MQPTTPTPPNQTPEKNSDDLIFSEIKRRLEDIRQSSSSLDTKAALTLTFTGAILAGLVNAAWFLKLGFVWHILILSGFGLTALIALAAVLARQFRQDPDPKALISLYANKSEKQTKGQLIVNFSDCYSHNAKIVANKGRLLKAAFIGLALSISILVIAIFFSTHNVTIK